MRNTLIRPGRLFLICIAALLYAASSAVLLGGVAPALVSSRDTLQAGLGFIVPAVWLIGSGCLALHFFLKFRACAEKRATTNSENHE
ncbi:hypothetical protein [Pseudomonas nitroreducens]|uniref:hypothetical protein n=1 Tax=Pseudomonas nitroreducens TaxID=46680 RepID=UPI0004664AE6|nr:hypothetical protein [Pseudomonas nitroreducens]